ncbi:hypothetical protein H5410_040466 [Solanum commersonii]|uniref:Uncharacterized protein n=1 Tax=Solanum commersonii TaxID=4109 RepID=A0A9J5XS30_SOLCO|nr:hypothetical protein H5410_040466 [Solanum commersonii]
MGNTYIASNITSELYTFHKGLTIAVQHNLTPIEISIDCTDIIQMLLNDHPSYSTLLYDCREILWQLGNPPVAGCLAREGAKLTKANSFVLWAVPPLCVKKKLDADTAEILFVRLKKPHIRTDYYSTYYVVPPPSLVGNGGFRI